jgi:ketosteroid isomerase-like protein/catechol 2,3-dioxygenase-like lactoylglutathione lyase family enzyme
LTTVSESPEVELLHRAWEAMSRGDFAVLEASLAKDARWLTVNEGATNCEGRSAVIEVMSRNLAGRLRGRIEEMIQTGPRVIVAFRPEQPSDAENRPLDNRIAYMVVTVDDGEITELKGCADRAAAVTYADRGGILDAPAFSGVKPPDAVAEPPEHRVNGLVPFVKVKDVERSVTFYAHLGFIVDSVAEYGGHLSWAALESDGAEIMFEGVGDSIDQDRQDVLFYLYSQDIAALRDQLLTAGIEAGEIEDGSPGPRQEMRVTDPDGYVLMVAQIE